ncbi:MAG: hypothetical protein ABIR52_08515 [Casimicrobiaceae bacterium]
MRIDLDIETHDRSLGFDIAGVDGKLRSGAIVKVPGGASLEYRGSLVRKAVDIPEVLKFIVDASVNVDLGILSAWLYDKVKTKSVERIVMSRRVITEITQDRIRQVLVEVIRPDE